MEILKVARNIVSKIDEVLFLIAMPALLLVVLLTATDVILRYIFASPIPGSVELVEILLVVAIGLSIAYCQLKKGHVAVGIVLSKLPENVRYLVEILNHSLSFVLWLIIAWQTLAQTALVKDELSAILHIPITPFYIVLSVGAGALSLTSLLDLASSFEAIRANRLRKRELIVVGVFAGLLVLCIIAWINPSVWNGTPFVVGVLGAFWIVIFIFVGLPVSFALGVVGILGIIALRNLDVALYVSGVIPYRTLASYGFSVIPCFVLMGEFVYHSDISRDIYTFARAFVGRLPGGLAISTICGCAGFAAISGDSLSTTMTMGTISLPEMRKYNYQTRLSTGSIAAGGTLGVLIPPSIVFILYGLLTEQSIGKLFIAGIFPGVVLTMLYCLMIYLRCRTDPSLGPPGPKTGWKDKVTNAKGIWTVFVLFFVVIGGIYAGVFTPTEAGAIGASGAVLIGVLKGRMKWKEFYTATKDGGKIISMAFTILIGAGILGYFLAASKLPMLLAQAVAGLPLPRVLILLLILTFYTFLGMLMPAIPMVIITVPLFYPVVMSLGYDPIWYGVVTVLMFELAVITPPVGINLYGLSGTAPDIEIGVIFRGVLPFVGIVWLCIIVLILFPSIATFLPELLFTY